MISTRNLAPLPDIVALRRLTQSLATLDAVLSPEWESRYYSFNSRWAEGEMMASMRDGSGDEWFLLFGQAGAILKGLAHESPMAVGRTWAGVISDVPAEFRSFLAEPAFSVEDATFCLWRTHGDDRWHAGTVAYPPGDDPDGSGDLLPLLGGDPRTYQRWAREYYEVKVSLAAVRHVYEHRPLTVEVLARLNPDVTLEDLADDFGRDRLPVVVRLTFFAACGRRKVHGVTGMKSASTNTLNRALINATLTDDIAAMQLGLAAGAKVDARDPEHQETPLMLARSEAAVGLLLNYKADVHARNDRGETALIYRPWRAVWERGGDINARSDAGETPLMKAVMTGDPERVGQVLAMGADVGLRDGGGRTALEIAVDWGLVGIAERLRAAIAVPGTAAAAAMSCSSLQEHRRIGCLKRLHIGLAPAPSR